MSDSAENLSVGRRLATWVRDNRISWPFEIGMGGLDSMAQRWEGFLARTWDRQVRVQPEFAPLEDIYLRSRTMLRMGRYEEAAVELAGASNAEPKLPEMLEAYGDLLEISGQSEAGQSLHDERRKLGSRRTAAPDRPMVLRQNGQFAAEVAAYTTSARFVGSRAFVYVALGNAFLRRRLPELALPNYRAARHLRPDCSAPCTMMGLAFFMKGAHEPALEAFNSALKLNAKDVEALSGRAMVFSARGDLERAIGDWRCQFDLLPVDRATARASVAMRMGDYSLALPELLRAVEMEPVEPYWRLYLLAANRGLGKSGDAVSPDEADAWPAPLLALHAGKVSPDEVLRLATTDGRRAEALFQIGVVSKGEDPAKARSCFERVIKEADPSLIEYGAARAELGRTA
jgi:tetratricopeptide (TPR) repeat protein